MRRLQIIFLNKKSKITLQLVSVNTTHNQMFFFKYRFLGTLMDYMNVTKKGLSNPKKVHDKYDMIKTIA